MGKSGKTFVFIKDFLYVILIFLLGVGAITFSILYLETFTDGVIARYSTLLNTVSVAIITTLTVLAIIFFNLSKQIVYKISLVTIIVALILLGSLYFLKISGFLDKVNSVEKFRQYISSFGAYAVVLFIVIQFLQVVVLPIPAFITVGAGVLLFGPLKGAIFSCIGIITGSLVAFVIGRIFGYRVVRWLVGKENLDKGLRFIKGKDKVILIFMFLFPFFPDDVMCFVAGITTITPTFYVIMIFITRIISVFASSFSMNNNLIPYDTWWGIVLWVLFIAFTIVFAIIICKKGNEIEQFFKKRKNKEKH